MPVRLGTGTPQTPQTPQTLRAPQAPHRIAVLALAGASLLTAAAVGSVFLSTARNAWTAIGAAGPAGPADGILLVAGLGGTVLSLWLGLGLTLSALSALPGALGHACRQLAARIAPAALRKVVAFVLGTTLTAALVPGTAAADLGHDARAGVVAAAGHPGRTGSVGSAVKAVGDLAVAAPDASFRFISDSPDAADIADAAPPPTWLPVRPEPPGERAVVVLRGDSLWSIAAHHLGPSASAADVDAEWPRWLAANRDVIGDDADLILPGQLLRPPSATRDES